MHILWLNFTFATPKNMDIAIKSGGLHDPQLLSSRTNILIITDSPSKVPLAGTW